MIPQKTLKDVGYEVDAKDFDYELQRPSAKLPRKFKPETAKVFKAKKFDIEKNELKALLESKKQASRLAKS